jgi:terminase small subunit-like protein
MSGPLRNTRHEKFVALLLQGESAVDAHEHAGYARDDNGANAARLRANPRVAARLAELQEAVSKKTELSIQSIIEELTDLTAKATNRNQFTAAIRAVVEKARIAGLLIERVEIGGPGSFEGCNSTAEVVDDMFKYMLNPYHAVTDQDREDLIALMNRHNDETNEFIEAIKARPYLTNNPPPKRLTFGNG